VGISPSRQQIWVSFRGSRSISNLLTTLFLVTYKSFLFLISISSLKNWITNLNIVKVFHILVFYFVSVIGLYCRFVFQANLDSRLPQVFVHKGFYMDYHDTMKLKPIAPTLIELKGNFEYIPPSLTLCLICSSYSFRFRQLLR
jgi:hypothetical protein